MLLGPEVLGWYRLVTFGGPRFTVTPPYESRQNSPQGGVLRGMEGMDGFRKIQVGFAVEEVLHQRPIYSSTCTLVKGLILRYLVYVLST